MGERTMTVHVDWRAPGPGFWTLDETHLPNAGSRYITDLFPRIISGGLQPAFRRYGVLIDHFEVRTVGGRLYVSVVPVGGPPPGAEHGEQPPLTKEGFQHLFEVVPELRQRAQNAAEVLERQTWRQETERWYAESREPQRQKNLALQAVDPDRLDDEALRRHVDEVTRNLVEGLIAHFDL